MRETTGAKVTTKQSEVNATQKNDRFKKSHKKETKKKERKSLW